MSEAVKNVNWLRSKSWYRLLKVLFIIASSIGLFVATFINWSIFSNLLSSDQYFVSSCKNNFAQAYSFDRESFLRYLIFHRENSNIDKIKEQRIRFPLSIDNPVNGADSAIRKKEDLAKAINWLSAIDEDSEIDWFCNIRRDDYSNPITGFIYNQILILVISFGIIELLKRTFYYIAIGKFNPIK